MNRSTPGLPVHHQLLEFTQTHVHLASDAIQPSHPLLSLLLLPPIPPSIRVFSIESTLRMRWPKYWSFSFNISPSNEHRSPLRLISFRMDWLDLLAPLRCTLSYCHNTGKSTVKIKAVSFNLKVGQKVQTVRKQKSVKPLPASSTLQQPSLKDNTILGLLCWVSKPLIRDL